MRRPISHRRIAALIGGLSLALTPFATSAPASASNAARCAHVVAPAPVVIGGVSQRIATVTGCTALSDKGVSGRSVTILKTHISVTTWAGGLGTTTAKITYVAGPTPNRCPAGTHLTISVGKVVGGSGAALAVIKVGETADAPLCVTAAHAATLEPGAAYRFMNSANTTSTVPKSAAPTTTRPTTPGPTTTTRPPTTSTTRPPVTTTTTVPTGNSPPAPVPLTAGLAACPASADSAMVALVNRDRQQTGDIPPLAENANLDWAARKHSIVMATNSVLSHDGWDTEIDESNYVVGSPGYTGQNIAWTTGGYSPDTIESMFFNEVPPDDGHRLNILSSNYHNIGIGCIVNSTTGAYWWSQDFGS